MIKSVSFLADVAMGYSRGKCDRGGCLKYRDKLLAERGLKVPGRAPPARKRPAAEADARQHPASPARKKLASAAAVSKDETMTAKAKAAASKSTSTSATASCSAVPPQDDTLAMLRNFFAK